MLAGALHALLRAMGAAPALRPHPPARLLTHAPVAAQTPPRSYFNALLKTIVHQQLAEKAAKAILEKVISALHSGSLSTYTEVTPEMVRDAVMTVQFDSKGKKKVLLNGLESGLSESKAKYLKSLSEHFLDDSKLKGVDLNALDDDKLIAKLVAVNGIGLWSVHMFMMFTLYRPNVLPTGDLGVRAGLCHFKGIDKKSLEGKGKEEDIKRLCESWAPYSSMGCSIMWILSDFHKK